MKKKPSIHRIYLQRFTADNWRIIYKRDNLSKRLFNYDEKNRTYSYSETYSNSNSKITWNIIINSAYFNELFYANYTYIKAKGNDRNFSITIESEIFHPYYIAYRPYNKYISEDINYVSYSCSFRGFFHVYEVINFKGTQKDNLFDKLRNMKNPPKNNCNYSIPVENLPVENLPVENVKKTKKNVSTEVVENCIYFKNKTCIYYNDTCNPNSFKCKKQYFPSKSRTSTFTEVSENIAPKSISNSNHAIKEQPLKAVVLSHNRKCVYEYHNLVDINIIVRVLLPSTKIINVPVLAAYCKECNQYIILKNDFKKIRQKGILLCQVTDETKEHLSHNMHTTYSATESRIHSLGYNVIKQYGYTFEQRKMILANIMENYNITKHEILSMIDTNIARKINLPNYADAINKWKQDREFVSNYKTGDIPEIIIDKVVVGNRK